MSAGDRSVQHENWLTPEVLFSAVGLGWLPWFDPFLAPVLQPHRILQALKRYVRAENKDRLHTIRHYQHVLAVDPEKAAQMKSQVWVSFCWGSHCCPALAVGGSGSCVLLGTTAASFLWSSPSLLCLFPVTRHIPCMVLLGDWLSVKNLSFVLYIVGHSDKLRGLELVQYQFYVSFVKHHWNLFAGDLVILDNSSSLPAVYIFLSLGLVFIVSVFGVCGNSLVPLQSYCLASKA